MHWLRTKDCYVCNDSNDILYRCRYQELTDWVFLCQTCLTDVKTKFEDSYKYGGTWKSKKKIIGLVSVVTVMGTVKIRIVWFELLM